MSTTLMCGLFVVAFTFKNDQINWLWTDNGPTAIILVILSILLGIQWFRHQRLQNKAKRSGRT